MVMVLPMYEVTMPGHVLQHRGGDRRRRHATSASSASSTSRRRSGFWEKYYFKPGNGRLPRVRHRGRQGRRVHLLRPPLPRGLACARAQRRRDRVQPVGHQPRPVGVHLAARAAGRRGGQHVLRRRDQPGRHRGARRRTTSTGRATSSTRRASSSATSAMRSSRSSSSATSTSTRSRSSATAGPSTATAGPTRTTSWSSADRLPDPATRPTRHRAHGNDTDQERQGRLHHGRHRPGRADHRRDHHAPSARPATSPERSRVPTRSSTPPASTSSPAASTCTPTWRCRSAAPCPATRSRPAPRAAAWGGVTTIVDMAVQNTGGNVQTGLADWHRKADGKCAIDYGVPPDHRWRRRPVAEGHGLPRRARGRHQLQAVHGLPGRALQRRRPDPAGDADRRRVRGDDHDARRERHRHRRPRASRRVARGDTDPRFHSYTRPSPLEAEATHRAIVLSHVAGNVPLYIVHMSAGDALNEVAAARHHGRNVFAETCPQYLWLTLEEHARQAGLRGRQVGVQHPAALARARPRPHRADGPRPPGRSVEGPADERAGGRQHRSLPVLHEGPEGDRASATSPPSRTGSAASSTGWS